jgi:hypothetical protein
VIATLYYGGRANAWSLFDFFSSWAFTLALLLVVTIRALAARGWRRPRLPELAVLFGAGLAVCSIAQTPAPWTQIARIRNSTPQPLFKQLAATRFVASLTRRGEKVEILIPLGHRIAYDLGLVNVSPYSSIESIPTQQQLQRTIDTLRDEHASKIFVSSRFTFPEEMAALQRAGFVVRRQTPEVRGGDIVELVDTNGGRA